MASFPASLFLDEQERFHLGWHDIYEESYYASGRLDQLDDPKAARVVRLQNRAFQPILTRTQGRTLAVYEDTYSHLMTVLPEEAPPRAVPLTRSRPRFAWHTFHSPQFALDRYGIAWLFFVDSARQHVFRTRWLGEDWGPIHNTAKLIRNSPRMEDNHLSIERLAVETGMGEGGAGNQDSGDPWGSTGPSFRSRPLAGGVSWEEGSLPGPGGGAGVGESPPAGEPGAETPRESRHPRLARRAIRMSTEPGTSCEY